MAGEMCFIDPITGIDDQDQEWSYHAAIAKAVNGTIQPFDQYQGPYVVVGSDIRIGTDPYAIAPSHLGVIRLWIISDEDDFQRIYREDTETTSGHIWDEESAAMEAMELLND